MPPMTPKKLMDYVASLDETGLYKKLLEIALVKTVERDEIKGKLLAIQDFKAVIVAHHGKDYNDLKNFIIQDAFTETLLRLLIAETDERKENVLSARASLYATIREEALKLI